MSLTRENEKANDRLLLIFGRYACCRRVLPGFFEGTFRLTLQPGETGLSGETEILLTGRGSTWQIAGRTLKESFPFYYNAEQNERLLFLLSEEMKVLEPGHNICLKKDERICVGSAFRNGIFYSCFSLVEEEHVEIFRQEKGYAVSSMGAEGVYVNGRILRGKAVLQAGESLDLYGLHILFLKEIMVCVCFEGICRTAKDKEIPKNPGWEPLEEKRQSGRWIQRRWTQEEEIHAGEMEVLLPKEQTRERNTPLILSIGPSLTMVIPMLFMAQLGSSYMGESGGGFYYLSAAMSGCSALLAAFWAIAGNGYRRHAGRREGKAKERQYREYLEGVEEQLLCYQKDNRRIFNRRYPPAAAFAGAEKDAVTVLWNRYYRQKDFLFLRLGMGRMPFQIRLRLSEGERGIVQRKLVKEAQELAEKFRYLDQVPLGIDLMENRQIGILEKETGCRSAGEISGVLFQLLMQIAACHCYTEVKTACFYRRESGWERRIAECLRWMPHSWSGDRKVRFLAGDEKEAGEILPVLTREIAGGRVEGRKEISIPWYIVLVLEEELIREEPLFRYITDPEGAYPVSAVYAGREREELPKSCRCFVDITGKLRGEILCLGEQQIFRQGICLEISSYLQVQQYVREIAGYRIREDREEKQLPEKVDFLQLYKCSRAEELESGRRWRSSKAGERLKVPIGYRAGGELVSLDVHEKFHGPHGLIAGTTGSGKSELLQTYLLSAAVSFSPEDVNFFVIDYKGGGTGNLLKTLPHCSGVISNLSGNQIKRAMSAIISENKRRQRLLGKHQVNHIDAYTKLYRRGKAAEPMPHLLLVIDEFAELKKEEPEFMQEVISLSQVGRSLGIHLLLATQKPAGTVDDKIWSNARFRLCLRVQDRQDSMDMLHNGDAALLTAPGQCYLQIGNHEYYELFQSGYCGGVYREEKKKLSRALLLSDTGKRFEREEAEEDTENRSQIEVLIDYVRGTAKEYQYPFAQPLWMPELPGRVLLSELPAEKTGMQDGPVITLGLCDDPENQCQPVLSYVPFRQGHLAVCGGPSTGKTTFLQTILWQLCGEYTPDEIMVLGVDMGREGIGCFCGMPNCTGVLKRKEDRELFFHHLKKLAERRKKRLSGISWEQYRRTENGSLPFVFLVIDNFGSFWTVLEEEQQEWFLKLASEGLALGIYLILAAGQGEIGGKLFEKIRTTMALEMSDRFQYGDVLRQYSLPVLPEENRKGRGLCRRDGRVLEFQTALALEDQGEPAGIRSIEKTGTEKERSIRERGGILPDKIPFLPETAEFFTLAENMDKGEESLPLGYSFFTGEICRLELKSPFCFLISGNAGTGRTTLLSCLIEGMLFLGRRAVIWDEGRRLECFRKREETVFFDSRGKIGETELLSLEKGGVFIGDMESFCRYLYRAGEGREERIHFWEQAVRGKGQIGFLAGICHPGRDYQAMGTDFFREFAAWQQGIHLGGNAAAQQVLSFEDLSYGQQSKTEPPGIGYWKRGPGRATERILLPERGRRREDDTGGCSGADAGEDL